MIPEHYWRIMRRWFWLIGGIAAAVTIFVIVAMPKIMGAGTPAHSSAVTLGVTRVVTLSGSVTVGTSADQDLMGSYTENIATRGNTPQFLRELSDTLKGTGTTIGDEQLARKLRFQPVPGLFRVDITAEAPTAEEAQLIASTAATLMVDDIAAEERRIRDSLNLATTEQQNALLARLNQVYTDRTARLASLGEPALREALDDLIRSGITTDVSADFSLLVGDLARITSDSQLAVLNSSATSLEQQLARLAETQRSFSDEILLGSPISVVDPVDTVQLAPAAALRTRDLGVMGLIAGLILGWLTATIVDGVVITNRMERARREEWEAVPSNAGIERYFSHD